MYRLLFAEDEKATREGILEGIKWNKIGIDEVRSAKNGAIALEILEEFTPDILLTDIKMPRVNGIQLATQIRKKFPDCSILIISGYSEKEYLKSAIYLKAVDFVDKPLRLAELQNQLLRAVLEQDSIRKQKKLLSENPSPTDLQALNPALDIESDSFLQKHFAGINSSVSDSIEKIDPLVQDILNIIHTQYSDHSLSLDSLGQQFYISAAYLCVRFKKAMGITLVHYINEYRIKASLPLLRDESLKLDAIAEMVGYENGNYYSKVFKKYMGCSPAQYRTQ